MSTDNFQWTDELVIEFARFTNTDAPTFQGRYADIEQFKASKQPKRERIEVLSMAIKKQWGDGKIDFECQLSYGISKYLFPAIKQAIESVLNNDTENKPSTETPPIVKDKEVIVTDNSDVACLSIKDVFSCYDDGSYIQHIPTDSALYKKLEQKVNQKLKQ